MKTHEFVIIAEFAREAMSFSKAVASAYEDILKTGATPSPGSTAKR